MITIIKYLMKNQIIQKMNIIEILVTLNLIKKQLLMKIYPYLFKYQKMRKKIIKIIAIIITLII